MALSKKLQSRAEKIAKEVVRLWEQSGRFSFSLPSENSREILQQLDPNISKPLTQAWDLCQSDIQSLEKEYSSFTVAKSYQPFIRKKILEFSGIQKYNSKSKKSMRQMPMSLFSYDISKLEKMNSDYRHKVQERGLNDLIQLNNSDFENLLSLAEKWLNNDLSSNQAIFDRMFSISLLSGRRFFQEVGVNAKFLLCNEDVKLENFMNKNNHVLFRGQAKGDIIKQFTPYPIRIIKVNPEIFVKSHLELQEALNNVSWLQNVSMEEKADLLRTRLSKYMYTLNPIINTSLKTMKIYCPSDTRKLYIAKVYSLIKEESGLGLDFTQMAAVYLGHTTSDAQGRNICDEKTSASYRKFVIRVDN